MSHSAALLKELELFPTAGSESGCGCGCVKRCWGSWGGVGVLKSEANVTQRRSFCCSKNRIRCTNGWSTIGSDQQKKK